MVPRLLLHLQDGSKAWERECGWGRGRAWLSGKCWDDSKGLCGQSRGAWPSAGAVEAASYWWLFRVLESLPALKYLSVPSCQVLKFPQESAATERQCVSRRPGRERGRPEGHRTQWTRNRPGDPEPGCGNSSQLLVTQHCLAREAFRQPLHISGGHGCRKALDRERDGLHGSSQIATAVVSLFHPPRVGKARLQLPGGRSSANSIQRCTCVHGGWILCGIRERLSHTLSCLTLREEEPLSTVIWCASPLPPNILSLVSKYVWKFLRGYFFGGYF